MKRLLIIFSILLVITFLAYSIYTFALKSFSNFDWHKYIYWFRTFDDDSSWNIHTFNNRYTTFKDNYAANNLNALDMNLQGIDVHIESYDGTSVRYDTLIESNFDLKLNKEIKNNTLYLKTTPYFHKGDRVKRSTLTIKIPKHFDFMNINITGGSLEMNSCSISNINADLTGVSVDLNSCNMDDFTLDLTGGKLNSTHTKIDSGHFDVTGGEVNFESLCSNDFTLDLTGGKSRINFDKYDNVTLELTGGEIKVDGIDKDSDFKGDISAGYVDLFGERHLKDFTKFGKHGNVKIEVTAGKVDFE